MMFGMRHYIAISKSLIFFGDNVKGVTYCGKPFKGTIGEIGGGAIGVVCDMELNTPSGIWATKDSSLDKVFFVELGHGNGNPIAQYITLWNENDGNRDRPKFNTI